MIDIISAETGMDLGVLDTEIMRAANILSIQLNSLEYAQDLGIDLKYFLGEDFAFQNESFKSYLLERLAYSGIDVTSVTEVVENLYQELIFGVGQDQSNSSMVAR